MPASETGRAAPAQAGGIPALVKERIERQLGVKAGRPE
jgi:hypothetical protein